MIRNDRNRIITIEPGFKRRTFFRNARIRNVKSEQQRRMQSIVNIILYRQLIVLSINASVGFEQMSVQAAQVNTFNSENSYHCIKTEHRINDCSKVNWLINGDLIHFNKRKRMCFDRIEQKEAEIRLRYDLSRAKTVRQYSQ